MIPVYCHVFTLWIHLQTLPMVAAMTQKLFVKVSILHSLDLYVVLRLPSAPSPLYCNHFANACCKQEVSGSILSGGKYFSVYNLDLCAYI